MKGIKLIADSFIRQVVTIDSLGSSQSEAQQMYQVQEKYFRYADLHVYGHCGPREGV